MTFNPEELKEVALRLMSIDVQSEAFWRTGINRLYYACHLVGRETTKAKGWFDPSYSATDHRGLINALRDQHKPYANKLNDLLRMREHVDYHMDSAVGHGNEDCKYCQERRAQTPLVDVTVWNSARIIAEDILPKLKSIAPSGY